MAFILSVNGLLMCLAVKICSPLQCCLESLCHCATGQLYRLVQWSLHIKLTRLKCYQLRSASMLLQDVVSNFAFCSN